MLSELAGHARFVVVGVSPALCTAGRSCSARARSRSCPADSTIAARRGVARRLGGEPAKRPGRVERWVLPPVPSFARRSPPGTRGYSDLARDARACGSRPGVSVQGRVTDRSDPYRRGLTGPRRADVRLRAVGHARARPPLRDGKRGCMRRASAPSRGAKRSWRRWSATRSLYVVIGGAAAQARGWPGRTEDIDMTPERSQGNLSRLAAAVEELGGGFRVDERRYPDGFRPPGGIDARTFRSQICVAFATRHGQFDVVLLPDGTEDTRTSSGPRPARGSPAPRSSCPSHPPRRSCTPRDRGPPEGPRHPPRMREILNPLSPRGVVDLPDRSRGYEPPER